MKIRYSLYKQDGLQADYDLSEKEALEKFGKLKLSRNCLWGELIGSDANNRNKVIDSFDNSDEVISYNILYEDHK